MADSSLAQQLREQVVFVLVQPRHPGNVGAAARAMKNMGLQRLVIVDPPAFDPQQARWMAPGCDDVVARLRVVATLDEALEGVHTAVATTARHRRYRQPVVEPAQFAEQVLSDNPERVTAVLFGREDHGLSQAEVQRCSRLLRIPTPPHASLNLAQAVLLVANHLFEQARTAGLVATGRMIGGRGGTQTTRELHRTDPRDQLADLPAMEPAVTDLIGLLSRVGYTRSISPDKVSLTARQALQSASLSRRELDALRGMLARVQWALDHPEVDWNAPLSKRKRSVTPPDSPDPVQ